MPTKKKGNSQPIWDFATAEAYASIKSRRAKEDTLGLLMD